MFSFKINSRTEPWCKDSLPRPKAECFAYISQSMSSANSHINVLNMRNYHSVDTRNTLFQIQRSGRVL